MTRNRFLALPLFALLSVQADSFPLPSTGDMLNVTLEGLLSQNPDTPGRVMEMEFYRLNGHWFMGGGHSPSYNRGTHRGVITFAEDDSLDAFRLQMDVQGDAWVRGGFAEVEVEWSTGDGRNYTGRYEGKAFGEPVSGTARGVFMPAADPLPGFTAAQRGQHPRLLFKESDLPALREKAQTEFGREALARFPESAVGLGMLYQLHGDEEYAGRAMEAVKVHMADMNSGDKSIRHRFWGYRLEQVAVTYDLCYHAWPEDFRAEVQDYITSLARRMHRERGAWTQYVQWHPENAYTAAMIYSGVIGMLTVADLPGEAPARPSPPEEERLAPKAWTLDIEVPRVELEPGLMPSKVWYSGPLSQEQFQAFLEVGGDLSTLELEADAVRTLARDTDTRGIERNRHTGNHFAICVNRASDTAFDTWNIFAARWQVGEAGVYHYESNHGGVVPFLNGQRVGNSTLLRLEPGEYTLVLAAPMGRPNPWAGVFVRPTLRPVSDGEVEEMQAAKNETYAQAMVFYRQEKADWEKLGGVDPSVSSLLRDALFWFRRYEENVFGAAGSQVGSTSSLALEGPALMATTYRNVTGKALARDNGFAYWLPRKLMAFSWDGEGREIHQDFFGRADFQTMGYQDRRDNRGLILASMFPSIAPAFQPAAWWFWQESGNPLAAQSVPRANRLVEAGHPGTSYNSIPVYAFLHAPLGMEVQHPAEALPRNWHDPITGAFIFRNGFENERDVVLQMTAQQTPNRAGRGTAGAFALRGLGYNWTTDLEVSMENVGGRDEQPVVLTLNPAQYSAGTGRVLSSRAFADGSGVVRMDLTGTYRNRAKDGEEFKQTRDNTGVLYPDVFTDEEGEISALRSILVDYSGNAGVPAVVIIHDKLSGVEDPFWSWPLGIHTENRRSEWRPEGGSTPDERVAVEKPDHVRLTDNGFELRQGNARMTTRFLSQDDLNVAMGGIQNKRNITRGYQTRTRTMITVDGSDTYLAVLTLGEGEPPEIKANWKGDTVEIKIGDAVYQLEEGWLDFAGREDEIPAPPLAGQGTAK